MKKERQRDRRKSTERQTDRRTRETYNCRCDTATLHVTEYVSVMLTDAPTSATKTYTVTMPTAIGVTL